VWCTGANGFGQLDDGTTVDRHIAVVEGGNPQFGGNIFAFTAGVTPCYVLATNVYCWGSNQLGAVGDGTTTDRSAPVQVATGADFIAGSGADGHNCLTTSGQLWCWGSNVDDALGVGPGFGPLSTTPVQVTALGSDVLARINNPVGNDLDTVGVGVHHTCAVKTDHTLWCWGLNDHGQLGDGTTTSQAIPVQVAALGTAVNGVAVSPNGSFTCAATMTGAFCWGRNDRGQLGDGTTVERHLPVPVAVSKSPRELSVGRDHACLYPNGPQVMPEQIWCWGANDHGQIGDGTTVERDVPVPIQLPPLPPGPPVQTVPAGGPGGRLLLALALAAVTLMRLRRRAV
jgi:alpha-tubulin suppressor-like RCC1 family protein